MRKEEEIFAKETEKGPGASGEWRYGSQDGKEMEVFIFLGRWWSYRIQGLPDRVKFMKRPQQWDSEKR